MPVFLPSSPTIRGSAVIPLHRRYRTNWPTRDLLGRAPGDLFDQTDVRVLYGRLWPLRLREPSMINRRTCQNAATLAIAGFALLLTTSGAFAFSASFAWCSGSPSFMLTDVPPETARLQFAMNGPQRAEFSSRRWQDRLQREGGGAVRRSFHRGASLPLLRYRFKSVAARQHPTADAPARQRYFGDTPRIT